jgi:hypothetical protein
MAFLYIAEFARLPLDSVGATIIAPPMAPIAEQKIPIGVSSVPSAPFSSRTLFVQIHPDSVCSIAFGPAPVATVNNQRVAASETRFVGVNPGDSVAVISNS